MIPYYVYLVPLLGVFGGVCCDVINKYVTCKYKTEDEKYIDPFLFLTVCVSCVAMVQGMCWLYASYNVAGFTILKQNATIIIAATKLVYSGFFLFANMVLVSWTLKKLDLYTIGLLLASNQISGFIVSILFLGEYPSHKTLIISLLMTIITIFSSFYHENKSKNTTH